MPFSSPSLRKMSRNRLEPKRRTGEPSPSFYPEGYGRARGSATEVFRVALRLWVKENFGRFDSPITFQYKLYRHRVVSVVGTNPYIKHVPALGKGRKGFIMQLRVTSIDGLPVKLWPRRDIASFSLTRMIGYKKIFLLPSEPKKLEVKYEMR